MDRLTDIFPPPTSANYGDVPHLATTGLWECDLATERLTWSDGVYDLFGLPRGSALERGAVAAMYAPASRIAMECARVAAIRDRTGFTMDAQIRVGDETRWIRIVAHVENVPGKVARLYGSKSDVSHEYAGVAATDR